MYNLFLSFLLISTLVGCSKSTNNEKKPSDNQETSTLLDNNNNKAPEFTLTSTDGKNINLSDYNGKIVILDFWATWCPPCRKGIPDLIEIQKEYGKDVVVIGVSLDSDTKSEVVPFIQKFGINYTVVYGTPELVQRYGGVDGIPTSFVINKNGEIVNKHIGLVPKSEFTDQINKLLNKS
ncbi:MAG: TlpA disulfide reductase family protein [Ignavibacteriaceae bacterium]|nr:TlpA disulfide reductase family protein [Ignavibacteriaceae bacterium]